MAVDALRVANWQRTKDGRKGRNRPKPISPLAKRGEKRYGGTDRPVSQVINLLEATAPGRRQAA